MPETLISALFERGAFTYEDTKIAANVLKGYAIGLPAYVAVKIFSTAYWSQQDTMSPVKISVITTSINIALSIALIWPFGVAGIAIATGLVGWIQVGWLYYGLRGQDALQFDARFKAVISKIILSTVVMAVILLALDGYFQEMAHGTEWNKILRLTGLVLIGLIVYGAGVIKTGAVKPEEIKKYLPKGMKK